MSRLGYFLPASIATVAAACLLLAVPQPAHAQYGPGGYGPGYNGPGVGNGGGYGYGAGIGSGGYPGYGPGMGRDGYSEYNPEMGYRSPRSGIGSNY